MNIYIKIANNKLTRNTLRIAVLIVLVSSSAYAQTKNLAYFKNAEKLYNTGDYFSAAKNYEYFLGFEALPKDQAIANTAYVAKLSKSNGSYNADLALYRLVESYHLLPSYSKAELYAKKAVSQLPFNTYPLAAFWYASALKANGKLAESRTQFTQFIKNYSKKDDYLAKAYQELKSLDFIEKESQIQHTDSITVEIIPFSAEAAYGLNQGPAANSIMFTSTSKNEKTENRTEYQTNIYQATVAEGSLINKMPIVFSSEVDLQQYGEAVINKDNSYLFFTGSTGVPGIAPSSIYKSKREGDKWGAPVLVEGGVNTRGSSSRQPMLSPDGRYLYFSSNRPGGKGKFDIWVSSLDSTYNPTNTINAGELINTSDDESSPFYHGKSQHLFFSSKGKIGMGGFDIYQAEGAPGNWQHVTNFGSPYNSERDDLYFFSPQNVNDNKEAYFSSNRNTDCCLEMFKTNASEKPVKEVVKEIVVKEPEKMDALTVYFDFDESKLSKSDSDALILFAKQITDKFFEIKIDGFTDGFGTVDYNMALAKRRIESCIEILNQSGIDQKHFVIYVGGECCPVEKETFEDGTDNPEARSKNRRATIRLIK